MRVLILFLYFCLALLFGACTYTVTDSPLVTDLANRMTAVEQRQDALEQRVNAQGERLDRMGRVLLK